MRYQISVIRFANKYFIAQRCVYVVVFFKVTSNNLSDEIWNTRSIPRTQKLKYSLLESFSFFFFLIKISDVVRSFYDFCKQMPLEILTRGRGFGHTLDTCPLCREYSLSGCSTVRIFSRRSYLPFSSFHFFPPKKPPRRRPDARWRTVRHGI